VAKEGFIPSSSALRRSSTDATATFDLALILPHANSNPLASSTMENFVTESSVDGGSVETQSHLNFVPQSPSKARAQVARQHIARVASVANWLLVGKMASHVVGAYHSGDYVSMGLHTTFLGGALVLPPLALKGVALGTRFVGAGRLLLGRSVVAGSLALPRLAILGLVTYDLVQQVQAYQDGDDRALVPIIGDVSIIVLETAALVTAVAGLFWVSAAAVSVFLGPITLIITTLIFLGVELYKSVTFVSDLMEHVELTWGQRLKYGFLDFVGFRTDEMNEVYMKPRINLQAFDYAKQMFNRWLGLEYVFSPVSYTQQNANSLKGEIDVYRFVKAQSNLWPKINGRQ